MNNSLVRTVIQLSQLETPHRTNEEKHRQQVSVIHVITIFFLPLFKINRKAKLAAIQLTILLEDHI